MYNPFTVSNIQEVTRNADGSFFYQLYSSNGTSNKILNDREKLNLVLSNPAVLRVFKLHCDLFSLGKFKAFKNGKELDNDVLVDKLNYPNPFQSQRQFLWDYMFWNMLGTAYAYTTSKVINDNLNIYFLNPASFEWTDKLCKQLDKIVLSNKSLNDLEGLTIKYKHLDNTTTTYKLKDIIPFFDLSNGLGNWYKGNSSLDALYSVIKNSASSIKSKDIALEFSGKYLVSGEHNVEDIHSSPMGTKEKESIERSTRSNKAVHAVKDKISIQRFVEDIYKLRLDDAYIADYYTIGTMYGTPRDILEAGLKGSTYENQKEASHRFVEQCMQPKGNDLADGLERAFGYNLKGIDLRLSFDHLSFMQIIEEYKANIITKKLTNLQTAKELGGLSDAEVKERIKLMML